MTPGGELGRTPSPAPGLCSRFPNLLLSQTMYRTATEVLHRPGLQT